LFKNIINYFVYDECDVLHWDVPMTVYIYLLFLQKDQKRSE